MTPPEFQSLVDHLRWRAQQHPARPLYTFLPDGETEDATMTFGEVDAAAAALAARLQEVAAPGERALLIFPPGLEYPIAFLACLYAGLVAVPAYPPEPGRPGPAMARVDTIIPESGARLILTVSATQTQAELARSRSPLADEITLLVVDELDGLDAGAYQRPGDLENRLAFLQYTSGSTGVPKGVMVSHRNLMEHQRLSHLVFAREEESVTVSWLPLYHDMGLIGGLLYPLYVGGRLIMMPPASFIRRPMRWLEAIHRYRAGVSTAPDFAYQMCVARATEEDIKRLDLSCWKLTVCGAEPLKSATLDAFCHRFASTGFRRTTFLPCHGMAEATLMVTGGRHDRDPIVRWFTDASLSRRQATPCSSDDPGARPHVSCGRPTEAHSVAIVDPDSHSTMPEGGVGEIWFQGPSVCEGYWARPDASRAAFEASRDGGCGPWMRTGDLGFVLEGELYPLGRLADLIQHEEGWFYPHLPELDLERSGVMRGPVVLVTDPSTEAGGQPIIAMGELRKSALDEEGPRHAAAVQQVLASAGVPVDEVIFVPPRTVGRTSSGKLRRFRWASILAEVPDLPHHRWRPRA